MDHLFKAINFIEENLENDLTLDNIASKAHLSPFHFARLFKGLVGQTVMGYVQRRRLSEAAQKILKDDSKLIDVALDFKFNSHEAFSRSFKKAFGVTPTDYKKTVKPIRLHYMEKFNETALDHLNKGINLTPRIEDRDEFSVVGLKEDFDDESKSDIPKLWDSFVARLNEIPSKVSSDVFGVCECSNIYESDFSYIACAPCEESAGIPEGMVKRTIPSSKYAIFDHKVRQENLHNDLQASIRYIWGTWLPSSKYEYTGTPDFEFYGPKFNPSSMDGIIEIYIPVKSKF